jgi:hypothetical protein
MYGRCVRVRGREKTCNFSFFFGEFCGYEKYVVLLHRISKTRMTMYRDPTAYVSDIEVLTGKSYSTAKRIMAKIRKFYGLSARQRVTIDQAKSFLIQE